MIERENIRKVIHVVFWGVLIGTLFMIATQVTFASEKDSVEVLKTLKEYGIDSIATFVNDIFRTIGFGFVKFLGWTVDQLYESIKTIYGLLSFGYSSEIKALVSRYSMVYKAIFMVAVVFFGLYLINGKNKDQLNTINCLILIALVVVAMPLFTEKMSKLTLDSSNFVRSQWIESANGVKVDSIASTVFKKNIVDLKKVDKSVSGSDTSKLIEGQGLNGLKEGTKDWRNLDINQVLDHGDSDLKQDFWKKQLVMTDNGKYELEDMGSFLGLMDQYYYRYQVVSWFNLIVMLLTIIVVLFFAAVKCGRVVIGVAQAQVYLPFIALTDLSSGQRIKEGIKHLITLFATIFLCIALLGVYFAGYSFINAKVEDLFPRLLMHIALAWAVIDGPNVIERIFGVDVGIKSGWQMLMGAKAGQELATGAAKNAGSIIKQGAGVTGKVAGKSAEVAVGKDKAKEMGDKMKKAPGEAMKSATDGKGLAGVAQNLKRGAEDKVTPKDSTKNLETEAAKAEGSGSQTRKYKGRSSSPEVGLAKQEGLKQSSSRPELYEKPDSVRRKRSSQVEPAVSQEKPRDKK